MLVCYFSTSFSIINRGHSSTQSTVLCEQNYSISSVTHAPFCSRFHVPDYTPNIGIFWYFFTEMFDHFRSLFVWTFQMHVLILYLFPFTIRLRYCPLISVNCDEAYLSPYFRNDPAFLFWLLCAIFCTFKSYPAYGDVAFYINYLPIWSFLFRCKYN
jgi:hypothetical protein